MNSETEVPGHILWRLWPLRRMMGAMSTFDIRHPHGDLLVHLHDESFNTQLRDLLKLAVPSLPQGEITPQRTSRLREISIDHPNFHLLGHAFGPICLEVIQSEDQLATDTVHVIEKVTEALGFSLE